MESKQSNEVWKLLTEPQESFALATIKIKKDKYPHNLQPDNVLMAYRMGFRDARKAASKLAEKADEQLELLKAELRSRSYEDPKAMSEEQLEAKRKKLLVVIADARLDLALVCYQQNLYNSSQTQHLQELLAATENSKKVRETLQKQAENS